MNKDEKVYVLVQDDGEETFTVVDKKLIVGNPTITKCEEFINNKTQQVLRWPTSESEKDLAQLAINYKEVDHDKYNVILLGIGTKKQMKEKEHEYVTGIVSDKYERKEVCKKNFSDDDCDNECDDTGNKLKKRKRSSDSVSYNDNHHQSKKIIKENSKKQKITLDDAVSNDIISNVAAQEKMEKIATTVEKTVMSVDKNSASIEKIMEKLNDLHASIQQMRSTASYTENLSTTTTTEKKIKPSTRRLQISMHDLLDESQEIVDNAVLDDAGTSPSSAEPFETIEDAPFNVQSCVEGYQQKANNRDKEQHSLTKQHQKRYSAREPIRDSHLYQVIGSKRIPIMVYNDIACKFSRDTKTAARKLCESYFGREHLNTHSWSGKKSNAFADREAKTPLDQSEVYELQRVQEACWNAGKIKMPEKTSTAVMSTHEQEQTISDE